MGFISELNRYLNSFSTACCISRALCVVFGQWELLLKLAIKLSYCHWSILQFWLPPQKITHCWNIVITAGIVNFMNFCFILMMHDVKVFNCYSFRNFSFKGSFSSEIFKVGFIEVSPVKVNRGLLNIEVEKLLLNFNVVVISLILSKTKTK